jgi:transcriptional regulator with PAS, ATPase and Fis domain
MATILHLDGFDGAPLERLQKLGFACHSFNLTQITDTAHGTENLVYLIPAEAFGTPEWARLRVRLAQSSRFFLAWVRHPGTAAVVECLRDGAHDVLSLDDTDERWTQVIDRTVADQKLWLELYGGRALNTGDVLIGKSPSIQRMRQAIDRLGATDVCVLIQGESGVGKERVASALHLVSHGGPFVALNCAAIPKDLLEAELFGVEKGAFTGALKSRPGMVEQANGGTLFLDEIGEMEIGVQPKLLRFLETRRARRVGGEGEYKVTLRVISATNRNLEEAIAEKQFRADLYYRLAETVLQIPPLRTRLEDVPELALIFLKMANERFGKNIENFEPALIERFQKYHWPGNVRELKSAVDRLVLLFDGPVLRAPWWDPPESVAFGAPLTVLPPEPADDKTGHASQKQKRDQARQLLQESDNDFTWVAAQLGINTSTLWRWRKTGKV